MSGDIICFVYFIFDVCVCACVCVFLVCNTLCVWLLKVIKYVGSLAFDLRVLFCVKCFTTCVHVSTYE